MLRKQCAVHRGVFGLIFGHTYKSLLETVFCEKSQDQVINLNYLEYKQRRTSSTDKQCGLMTSYWAHTFTAHIIKSICFWTMTHFFLFSTQPQWILEKTIMM